jgi:hypothetical protein
MLTGRTTAPVPDPVHGTYPSDHYALQSDLRY